MSGGAVQQAPFMATVRALEALKLRLQDAVRREDHAETVDIHRALETRLEKEESRGSMASSLATAYVAELRSFLHDLAWFLRRARLLHAARALLADAQVPLVRAQAALRGGDLAAARSHVDEAALAARELLGEEYDELALVQDFVARLGDVEAEIAKEADRAYRRKVGDGQDGQGDEEDEDESTVDGRQSVYSQRRSRAGSRLAPSVASPRRSSVSRRRSPSSRASASLAVPGDDNMSTTSSQGRSGRSRRRSIFIPTANQEETAERRMRSSTTGSMAAAAAAAAVAEAVNNETPMPIHAGVAEMQPLDETTSVPPPVGERDVRVLITVGLQSLFISPDPALATAARRHVGHVEAARLAGFSPVQRDAVNLETADGPLRTVLAAFNHASKHSRELVATYHLREARTVYTSARDFLHAVRVDGCVQAEDEDEDEARAVAYAAHVGSERAMADDEEADRERALGQPPAYLAEYCDRADVDNVIPAMTVMGTLVEHALRRLGQTARTLRVGIVGACAEADMTRIVQELRLQVGVTDIVACEAAMGASLPAVMAHCGLASGHFSHRTAAEWAHKWDVTTTGSVGEFLQVMGIARAPYVPILYKMEGMLSENENARDDYLTLHYLGNEGPAAALPAILGDRRTTMLLNMGHIVILNGNRWRMINALVHYMQQLIDGDREHLEALRRPLVANAYTRVKTALRRAKAQLHRASALAQSDEDEEDQGDDDDDIPDFAVDSELDIDDLDWRVTMLQKEERCLLRRMPWIRDELDRQAEAMAASAASAVLRALDEQRERDAAEHAAAVALAEERGGSGADRHALESALCAKVTMLTERLRGVFADFHAVHDQYRLVLLHGAFLYHFEARDVPPDQPDVDIDDKCLWDAQEMMRAERESLRPAVDRAASRLSAALLEYALALRLVVPPPATLAVAQTVPALAGNTLFDEERMRDVETTGDDARPVIQMKYIDGHTRKLLGSVTVPFHASWPAYYFLTKAIPAVAVPATLVRDRDRPVPTRETETLHPGLTVLALDHLAAAFAFLDDLFAVYDPWQARLDGHVRVIDDSESAAVRLRKRLGDIVQLGKAEEKEEEDEETVPGASEDGQDDGDEYASREALWKRIPRRPVLVRGRDAADMAQALRTDVHPKGQGDLLQQTTCCTHDRCLLWTHIDHLKTHASFHTLV